MKTKEVFICCCVAAWIILLMKLLSLVVCLSPDYSDSNLQEFFHEWRKKNRIPYKRGRLNEQFGRKCSPPKIRFN